jgi:hypothetical protein
MGCIKAEATESDLLRPWCRRTQTLEPPCPVIEPDHDLLPWQRFLPEEIHVAVVVDVLRREDTVTCGIDTDSQDGLLAGAAQTELNILLYAASVERHQVGLVISVKIGQDLMTAEREWGAPEGSTFVAMPLRGTDAVHPKH